MPDRRALVARHTVRRRSADPMEPLSVGNGEFAFTVDVTGLQTLSSFHAEGMPLGTQAHWGWHTAPNPRGFRLEDSFELYETPDGRRVPYSTTARRHAAAAAWLRENPHRIDLGRIGFVRPDGSAIAPAEITGIDQRLDLWRGRIDSRFHLSGSPVGVTTVCHPTTDLIAVRVESALLRHRAMAVSVRFPYAVGDWSRATDWDATDAHTSEVSSGQQVGRVDVRRVMDADVHHVAVQAVADQVVGERSPGAGVRRTGPHALLLWPGEADVLEFVVGFGLERRPDPLPSFDDTLAAAAEHWAEFWRTGGCVDLSGSTDPRAPELERRIVLSQYLTAVHCSGSMPPQETGLVTNSWRGKFHLEMHWWHAAHFPLWGRAQLLERSLAWYDRILPVARATARAQGYDGARWPKQVGPEGRESPSDVGAFLIWQQPHPISYAELIRRSSPTRRTLERFADVVLETAAFMVSYARWDGGRYCLGPPLASAQEKAFRERTVSRNPTFELAYWAWGLQTAQRWRERLGLGREPAWDEVARTLAPLPIREGRYVELEHPVTRSEGHPAMVGALGMVPDTGLVDHDVMRATLRHVFDAWDLRETWGWDYPLLAMTACRLDDPDRAVDALLLESPKNRYLANGHNVQELPRLPLYLPGNGGLLYAVAMMAAGWDGGPDRPAPGFPRDRWRVVVDGLLPAP